MLIYMVNKININLQFVNSSSQAIELTGNCQPPTTDASQGQGVIGRSSTLIAPDIRGDYPQFHWAGPNEA
jgi:hypothetical protein